VGWISSSENRRVKGLIRLWLYLLLLYFWGLLLWSSFIIIAEVVFFPRFLLSYSTYFLPSYVVDLMDFVFGNLWFTPYYYAIAMMGKDLFPVKLISWIVFILGDIPSIAYIYCWNLVGDRFTSLFTEIDENVLLGSLPFISNVPSLKAIGVCAVINLCIESEGPKNDYEKHGILQLHLPTIDMFPPSVDDIERAMNFIDQIVSSQNRILKERKEENSAKIINPPNPPNPPIPPIPPIPRVLVHCKFGMGRSATIVLCYMITRKGMTLTEATKRLKELRPEVQISVIAKYRTVLEFLRKN